MCAKHLILSPERRLHGVAQPEDSPQTQETKLRGESGAGSTAPVARRALPDEYDDGVGRIHVEVIPVTDRNAYLNALEKASVGEDIVPFADFFAGW